MMILESGLETGTNTDILQGTRLQSIPSNGILSFELQAADAVAANNYVVSVELPNGNTPVNGVIVPSGETAGLAGIIDDRLALKLRFFVGQGGHPIFSCVEVGDTELSWRVSFTALVPRRR